MVATGKVTSELFLRTCRLVVGTLDVSNFHIHFKIDKTLKPEPNKALVEIWNLSPEHQAQLSELAPGKKVAKKKGKTSAALLGKIPVRLDAGYIGPGNDLLFLGDLRTVDTEVNGPDWVTSLTSGDGERAFRTARINKSFSPGVPVSKALEALVSALGVGRGNLSRVLSQLQLQGAARALVGGAVFSGPVARELTNFCRAADLEWSIQDGALQFVDLNTALADKAIVLTPETGLVGSPSVDAAGVMACKSLIMPGLRPGRIAVLKSREIKGQFRIESVSYDGDNYEGDWLAEVKGKRY
jgi:hypothetical protein